MGSVGNCLRSIFVMAFVIGTYAASKPSFTFNLINLTVIFHFFEPYNAVLKDFLIPFHVVCQITVERCRDAVRQMRPLSDVC